MDGPNAYFDQKVYIAASGSTLTKIDGVQGFDADWSLPITEVNANGYGFIEDVVEGTLEGSVSINKIITSQQNIFGPLFNSTLTGSLCYGSAGNFDRTFSFLNGYINSYSTSCAVNDLGTEEVNISCYGGLMGSGATGVTQDDENTVYIAKAGDIDLSIAAVGDPSDRLDLQDAVQSYTVDVNIDRLIVEPGLGSNFRQPMSDILVQYPIKVETSVELLVSNYQSPKMLDLICDPDKKNISIILKNCEQDITIRQFEITGSRLISHSSSSSVGNNMTVNLNFVRYVTGIAQLSEIIQ